MSKMSRVDAEELAMHAGVSGKMFRGFVKDGYFITKEEVAIKGVAF